MIYSLIKIILPALVVIGALTWLGYSIYNNGYNAADAKWQTKHDAEVNRLNEKINSLEAKSKEDAETIKKIMDESSANMSSIVNSIPEIKFVDHEDKPIECPGVNKQVLKIKIGSEFSNTWNLINEEANKAISATVVDVK